MSTSLRGKREAAARRAAFSTQFERALERLSKDDAVPTLATFSRLINKSQTVDWESIPVPCRVDAAQLPEERLERKRVQLENIIEHVAHLIRLESAACLRIVEFCGGTASLTLALAAMFPACEFFMWDNKRESLLIAIDRVKESKLKNVRIIDESVEDFCFTGSFDVGFSLHACGWLSDRAIEISVTAGARAIVACPCCVGKVVQKRTTPLSTLLKTRLTSHEFCSIVAAADDNAHSTVECPSMKDAARRKCKLLAETDRMIFLKERGYDVVLAEMHGGESSPKSDIIIARKGDLTGYVEM